MWQGAPYLPERSRVSPRKLYKKKRTMPSKRGRSLFDVQKEENKKKVRLVFEFFAVKIISKLTIRMCACHPIEKESYTNFDGSLQFTAADLK